MNRRMVLGAMAGMVGSSCYGKFALTNKLHAWNGSIGSSGTFGGRFVSTLIFWVFCIVPVYGATLFIDAVVLNLIEFWTGNNPMATLQHPDGSTTELQRVAADRVRIKRSVDGAVVSDFELAKTGEHAAEARSLLGDFWTGSVERLPNGDLAVRDGDDTSVVSVAQQEELSQQSSLAQAVALASPRIATRSPQTGG